VLAVGRLSRYKGVHVLVDALAQLPQARLLLIGTGECEGELRARAAERGVAARLSFAGELEDADLAAAYASADVFALPSLDRSEAFGLVLLEAMRAGLPVVASAIPGSGVVEVVEDAGTGLLVAPGDAAAFARALADLSGDAALRARLGAAGRARWQQAFTLGRSALAVESLYREVLASARSARA
jgi:glycosyltransferase involved in cell wall biosynthesis